MAESRSVMFFLGRVWPGFGQVSFDLKSQTLSKSYSRGLMTSNWCSRRRIVPRLLHQLRCDLIALGRGYLTMLTGILCAFMIQFLIKCLELA